MGHLRRHVDELHVPQCLTGCSAYQHETWGFYGAWTLAPSVGTMEEGLCADLSADDVSCSDRDDRQFNQTTSDARRRRHWSLARPPMHVRPHVLRGTGGDGHVEVVLWMEDVLIAGHHMGHLRRQHGRIVLQRGHRRVGHLGRRRGAMTYMFFHASSFNQDISGWADDHAS